jgi:hypothetical protein
MSTRGIITHHWLLTCSYWPSATITDCNSKSSHGVKTPSRAQDQILVLSDSCRFVDVGRPLWREDGPVVYNCCWSSPAQSFSGPSPAGLVTIFYCLRFETPSNLEGQVPVIIYSQEQGGPIIPPSCDSLYIARAGPNRKHRFQQYRYCYIFIRFRGNLFM